jgi:hypothetical protein
MAINTDTHVERIDLTKTQDLKETIVNLCELQSQRDNHRRLVAAFAARDQVILIFQRTAD